MAQRPLVLIYQEFEAVTVSVSLPDLNCLLVGPCYALWDYDTDKADIQVSDYGDLDCEAFGTRPAGPQLGDTQYAGNLPSRVSTDRGAPDSIQVYFDELYAELCHGTGATVDSLGTALSVPVLNPPKRQEGADPNGVTDFITADVAVGDTVVLFPAYAGVPYVATEAAGSTELDYGSGELEVESGITPSVSVATELILTGAPGDFDLYTEHTRVLVSGSGVADHNGYAYVKTATTDVLTVYKDGGGTYSTGGTPGTTAVVTPVRNLLWSPGSNDPFDGASAGNGYVEIAGIGTGFDGVYPIIYLFDDNMAVLGGANFPSAEIVPFKVFEGSALETIAASKTAQFLAASPEPDGDVTEVPIGGFSAGSRDVDLGVDGAALEANVGKYFIVTGGIDYVAYEILSVEAGGGTDRAYRLNTGGDLPTSIAAASFIICDTPCYVAEEYLFASTDIGNYLWPIESPLDISQGNKIATVATDGLSCTLTDTPADDGITGFLLRGRVQTTVAGPITALGFNLMNSLTNVYAITLTYGLPIPFHVMHKFDDVALPSTDWTYDDPQDNYITIDGGLTTLYDNYVRVIVNAETYIEHHDLRKDVNTLDVQTIETVTDITTKLGKIVPENPLALLTAVALSNTNTSLQALGVDGDNLGATPDLGVAYLTARDTVSSRNDIYAIVPATIDTSVLAMWKAHAEALADPEVARFRVVLGAWELPTYRPVSTTPLISGAYEGGQTAQEATAPTVVQVFKDATVDDTASARYVAYGGTNAAPTFYTQGYCLNDGGTNSNAMSLTSDVLETALAAAGDLVLVRNATDPDDDALYVVAARTADKVDLQKVNGVEAAWGIPSSYCEFALFQQSGSRLAGNEASILNGANASLIGATNALACFDLPIVDPADVGKWFNISGAFGGGPAHADDGLYRISAVGDLNTVMANVALLGSPIVTTSCTASTQVVVIPGAFADIEGAVGWILTISGSGAGNDGEWVIADVADGGSDIANVTVIGQKDDPSATISDESGVASAANVTYGAQGDLLALNYVYLEKFNTTTRAWETAVLTTDAAAWGDALNVTLHETAVEYNSVGTKVYGQQDNLYQNRQDSNGQAAPGDNLFIVQDGSGSATSLVGVYEILKVNAPTEFEIALISGAGFPEAIAAKNVAYYIMRDTDGDGTADTFIGLGTDDNPLYASAVTTEAPDARFVEFRNAYATFVTDGVAVGDRLDIIVPLGDTDVIIEDWDDDDDYVTLFVAEVINENRLLIDTSSSRDLRELPSIYNQAAAGQIGRNNVRYRVQRTLTKDTQVDYLEAYSAGFDSKRVVLVWPDQVELGALASGTHEGFYLAAVVGGMVAGLPSQQGFTNLGIAAVDRLYNSTPYFSNDQITDISNAGWMVFIQDTPSSLPYCVHQLTTHQSGIFDFEEFSVVKNFDFVAMAYKVKLETLLGRYNLTEDTIGLVRAGLNGVTGSLKALSYPFLGAPILSASISSLGRLAGTSDRVEANMSVTYPRPMNRIGLHLVATS